MTPSISITPAARRALLDNEASTVRMRIDDRFACELSVEPQTDNDLVVESDGIRIVLDPSSAERADGATIDFLDGPRAGFTIDTPNRPVIRQISAPDLRAWQQGGAACLLIDVRTDSERALACIEGSRLLDQACHDALLQLPKDTPIVFQCHHGVRSQSAAEYFLRHGFTNLHNLVGGIDAWSLLVDPAVPRY